MFQHIAIQRVDLGIVDVRRQHALAQIIQLLWRAALCGRGAQNIAKRAFEQIGRHITVRLWRIIDFRSGFPNGGLL